MLLKEIPDITLGIDEDDPYIQLNVKTDSLDFHVDDDKTIAMSEVGDNPVALSISEKFVISEGDERQHYKGQYEVEPDFTSQTLETKYKVMDSNVTINPIEVSRTSNEAGGKTVYIGGII